MEIIKADLKDKEAIKSIANLLYIDVNDFVWNKDEYIEKQIINNEYFLAKVENKIAGIISFRIRNSIMYIETLAVIKDFQSKGIGTKLINFAKKYTTENNLTTLRAYAFYQYNTQKFYLKNNFEQLKDSGDYNGAEYHRFQMQLS